MYYIDFFFFIHFIYVEWSMNDDTINWIDDFFYCIEDMLLFDGIKWILIFKRNGAFKGMKKSFV